MAGAEGRPYAGYSDTIIIICIQTFIMRATTQTILLLSACLLGLAAATSSGDQDQSQGRAIFSNYTSGRYVSVMGACFKTHLSTCFEFTLLSNVSTLYLLHM